VKFALATACVLAAPLAGAATAYAEAMSENKAREIGQTYGNCVISQRSRTARFYVLNDVPDTQAMRWRKGIVVSSCLNVRSPGRWERAQFPADHHRYVLAQALFKRDLVELPAPTLIDIPSLSHRPMPDPLDPARLPTDPIKAEEAKAAFATKSVAHLADMLAECSVRRDPAAAKALLVAPIGTPEEDSAFKALAPAMSHCIPTGKQVRLNRTVTKGSIALNYYRLAAAAGMLPDKLMPKPADEPGPFPFASDRDEGAGT
jgi:hypothetical protein